MRWNEIEETILSMSELAELVPAAREELAREVPRTVTVDEQQQAIVVHARLQGLPITATYVLRSGDAREFRLQLAGAWRSSQRGREFPANRDLAALIDHQTLRPHALTYLTNQRRWRQSGITIDGHGIRST
jgi:hypothetical protein